VAVKSCSDRHPGRLSEGTKLGKHNGGQPVNVTMVPISSHEEKKKKRKKKKDKYTSFLWGEGATKELAGGHEHQESHFRINIGKEQQPIQALRARGAQCLTR